MTVNLLTGSQEPLTFKPYAAGFYPVVDNSEWIERLAPLGVPSMQLRIKQALPTVLEQEIKRSVTIARKYGTTLFINDYWPLAIKYGADGVHLGQEDLYNADLTAIHRAGLLLGISTHCADEVARAQALHPSYLACGPIYATTSKVMAFAPQGIQQLHHWKQTLNYPLVAIGGITLKRLPEILSTGVDGVALISAVTQAPDPLAAASEFLTRIRESTHA